MLVFNTRIRRNVYLQYLTTFAIIDIFASQQAWMTMMIFWISCLPVDPKEGEKLGKFPSFLATTCLAHQTTSTSWPCYGCTRNLTWWTGYFSDSDDSESSSQEDTRIKPGQGRRAEASSDDEPKRPRGRAASDDDEDDYDGDDYEGSGKKKSSKQKTKAARRKKATSSTRKASTNTNKKAKVDDDDVDFSDQEDDSDIEVMRSKIRQYDEQGYGDVDDRERYDELCWTGRQPRSVESDCYFAMQAIWYDWNRSRGDSSGSTGSGSFLCTVFLNYLCNSPRLVFLQKRQRLLERLEVKERLQQYQGSDARRKR